MVVSVALYMLCLPSDHYQIAEKLAKAERVPKL